MIHQIVNISEIFSENVNSLLNSTEASEIYDSFWIEKAFYNERDGFQEDHIIETVQWPILTDLRSILNISQKQLPSP